MIKIIQKSLRLILLNQIEIMTALYYVPGLPEKFKGQIVRAQEETADFLEGKT